MKKALGLDCDGVIANFSAFATAAINRALGTDYTDESWTAWDTKSCLGEEADAVVRSLMSDGGCYGELAPFPGALEAVAALATEFDVFLVTSLPPNRRAYAGRRAWIERHGFRPFITDIVVAGSSFKPTIAREWPMAAFVEDHPATAPAIAEAGVPSFLVDRPCNRTVPAVPGMWRGTLVEIAHALLGERECLANGAIGTRIPYLRQRPRSTGRYLFTP